MGKSKVIVFLLISTSNVSSLSWLHLLGSMFGEKIMIITPLLKWYLLKGLVVTRIYQVVEYSPATCFQKFGEAVSDARRAGDADPLSTSNVSSLSWLHLRKNGSTRY
jgi:hypothetical protein